MNSLAYVVQLTALVVGLVAIFCLAPRGVLPSSLLPGRGLPLWTFGLLALGLAAVELLSFRGSAPLDRFHDFLVVYYPAGKAVAHGDPSSLRALTEDGVSGFVNMPIIAYLFAPFGLLPRSVATALFTLIGLGLAVGAWFLLVRLARLELRERWLLALLFLVNGPLMNAVKLGNTSHLMLFAFAAGLALLRARRSGWAGALLGAAAMLKPALILFGVFFVLKRDVRATLGFAAVCAATSALSLALFGWADNVHWFETSVLRYSQSWLAAFSNQSIPAFIYRLHAPPDILLDWLPHSPRAGEKLLAKISTGLILLIAAAACLRRPGRPLVAGGPKADERRDLQYLLVICVCLVSSPLVWAHYYAWLLIPTAFFMGSQLSFPASRTAHRVAWAAVLLVNLLIIWPPSIANPGLMAAYRAFGVSTPLFGGLLWFGIVAWWLASADGLLARPAPREGGPVQPTAV